MGFNTTDWVALFIFGVSAPVGTFGKTLVRIIGLAAMPFAFAGLVLSLSHHASAPEQGSITVGARPDWNIADQYAQYLKAKGFDVSFSRTSETVPPLDYKITIRDDPTHITDSCDYRPECSLATICPIIDLAIDEYTRQPCLHTNAKRA
jgi:hypothetical protein